MHPPVPGLRAHALAPRDSGMLALSPPISRSPLVPPRGAALFACTFTPRPRIGLRAFRFHRSKCAPDWA
jgi:hypothetical protein